MALCLLLLSDFPCPTFIPCTAFIPCRSRVTVGNWKISTLDRNLLTSSLWHANKTSSRWQYRIHVVWSSYGLLASWLAENTWGRKFFGTFLGGPPIESLETHGQKNQRRGYKNYVYTFFYKATDFSFDSFRYWYDIFVFLPTLIEMINK